MKTPGPCQVSANRKETDLYARKSAQRCEGKHIGARTNVWIFARLNPACTMRISVPKYSAIFLFSKINTVILTIRLKVQYH